MSVAPAADGRRLLQREGQGEEQAQGIFSRHFSAHPPGLESGAVSAPLSWKCRPRREAFGFAGRLAPAFAAGRGLYGFSAGPNWTCQGGGGKRRFRPYGTDCGRFLPPPFSSKRR